MLLVDVGNTNIKVSGCGTFPHDSLYDAGGELNRVLKSAKGLMLSSVVPGITSKIKELIGGGQQAFYVLERNAPFSYKCNLKGVGIDRMLSVQGALTLSAPPLIAIDIGTAVTVDICVSEKGSAEFVSGLIMPGLDLMLKSMSEHAAQLSMPGHRDPAPLDFGKDTESAMIDGARHCLVGGIEKAVNGAIKKYGIKNAQVFITGGGAAHFYDLIDKDLKALYVPDLVFRGMEYLAEKYTEVVI